MKGQTLVAGNSVSTPAFNKHAAPGPVTIYRPDASGKLVAVKKVKVGDKKGAKK